MHFNALTPAEAERLALLLEEMGEVQQIVGKILCHGYESFDPTKPAPPEGETNREMLSRELGDLVFSISLLFAGKDVNEGQVIDAARAKGLRVHKYLHHQK